jgi:HKD family nuclease
MPFDILSLKNANFPDALCPNCAAVVSVRLIKGSGDKSCDTCGVVWRRKDLLETWKEFFDYWHMGISDNERIQHAMTLAAEVEAFQSGRIKPIDLLFQLLSLSKFFVHFATYNVTTDLLGALAMLSTRIPVRGIIGESFSKPSDAYKLNALKSLTKTCKKFRVQLTATEMPFDGIHQKLYVFDGIVAIYGSPNLTLEAWNKAADSKELLKVSSDLDEVRELNNKYICKHIRRLEDVQLLTSRDKKSSVDNVWFSHFWKTYDLQEEYP